MSDFYILKDNSDNIMRFKMFSDEFVITNELDFPIFIVADINKAINVANKSGYGDFNEPFNSFDNLIITKCLINITAEYPNLS